MNLSTSAATCRHVAVTLLPAFLVPRLARGVEWSGSVAAAAAATGGKCGVPQRNTGGGGGGGSVEFEGEGGRERVKGFQRNELRACVARPFTAASAAVEAMGKGRRTRHVLLEYCTCARARVTSTLIRRKCENLSGSRLRRRRRRRRRRL